MLQVAIPFSLLKNLLFIVGVRMLLTFWCSLLRSYYFDFSVLLCSTVSKRAERTDSSESRRTVEVLEMGEPYFVLLRYLAMESVVEKQYCDCLAHQI